MIRKPRVAGMFYPGTVEELNSIVTKYLDCGPESKKKAMGIVVPHAGYIYSGKVAGMTISSVEIPGIVILLGPNHSGRGEAVGVVNEGEWEIPGRSVEIDTELADELVSASDYAALDIEAHAGEHSLEVQLPFITAVNPDVKIVPVCIGTHNMEILEDLGSAIAEIMSGRENDIMLLASSDMSHYISQSEAQHYDHMVIDRIKALDHIGLMDVVSEENISMCGAAPVAVLIKACSEMGALSAELVHYNTSAEASGDTSEVVGYAGLIIN